MIVSLLKKSKTCTFLLPKIEFSPILFHENNILMNKL